MSNFSTAILQYSTGRFGIVGSVPYELSEPVKNSVTLGARNSKVYGTEQEVIDALLSIGITHFQKANTEWYDN